MPRTKKAAKIEKPVPKAEHYFEAIGRRKTAIARVRFFPKGEKSTVHTQEFLVNGKPHNVYFPDLEMQQIVTSPLSKMSLDDFRVTSRTKGGGLHSQAEAVRHGVARALVLFDAGSKKRLKGLGYITRDPRMRERKKFGLKRARRAPQWQKR